MSGPKNTPVVGLIPAGGRATRLAPLPCSKEIVEIGFVNDPNTGERRSKVVSEYLVDSYRRAGIENAFLILAPDKWDIPAHFGNGAGCDMHLAYLVRALPFGLPYTLDEAFPFVKDCKVAFGFPDIIFQPENAFVQLIARQKSSAADVVLGVFPVDKPERWDAVEFDIHDRIQKVHTKPHKETTGFTWILAVWTPAFTRFMHGFVENAVDTTDSRDVSLGRVLQAALEHGLSFDHVVFEQGSCLDVGTPEDLERALHFHDTLSSL